MSPNEQAGKEGSGEEGIRVRKEKKRGKKEKPFLTLMSLE